MLEAHCRIGKVRLKSNGAEIYELTSARDIETQKAWSGFKHAANHTVDHYSEDLDGFVIVTWNAAGEWNVHYHSGWKQQCNTLPNYVKTAITRRICEDDARTMLEDTLQNR